MDRLQVDLAFQVDQLSAVMLLVVTGVGSLIHLFSVGYMKEDPGYARYFAYLNLFVVFMLVLVLGSSFPVMFIGWEGVGLCSYLLIGFWFAEKANADAGKKAFIVNRIGDFGFLVAMFFIWRTFGSLDFTVRERARRRHADAGRRRSSPRSPCSSSSGCTGKSAQIPLYTWLPDAMAGPTPVSALIHAATMVTAGVYLVARTNVLFALAPVSSTVVAGIGALTALFAATIGLRQYDIKKVLAYSTVSQLGYMFLGVGTGAYVSGVFHLVTHAFFKALLFLGSGSVIHAMHHAYHATHSHDDAQDMRNMGGLRRYMPWTFGLMLIATLAIAGIPPFSGFFSKDEILAAAFARGGDLPVFYVFYGMGVLAALLTAFYMARLMAMTFLGENRTGEAERAHLHEAPWIMTGPLVVLGVLSLAGGVLNLPHLRRRARGARALARAGDGAGASPAAAWSCPTARPSTCWSAPRSRSARSACSSASGPRWPGRSRRRARRAAGDRLRPGAQPQVLRGRALRRGHRPAGRLALAGRALEGRGPGRGRRRRRERRGLGSPGSWAAGSGCCRPGRWASTWCSSSWARLDPSRRDPVTADDRLPAVDRLRRSGSCTPWCCCRSSAWCRSCWATSGRPSGRRWSSPSVEFVLSAGLWWALDAGVGRLQLVSQRAVDRRRGASATGSASTASRSSWCCSPRRSCRSACWRAGTTSPPASAASTPSCSRC